MLDSEDLIIKSFILISLSIFNEQELSFLPASAHSPSLMEFKCGRFDITVDNGSPNALSPNSMEFKCGRSIH